MPCFERRRAAGWRGFPATRKLCVDRGCWLESAVANSLGPEVRSSFAKGAAPPVELDQETNSPTSRFELFQVLLRPFCTLGRHALASGGDRQCLLLPFLAREKKQTKKSQSPDPRVIASYSSCPAVSHLGNAP